MKRNKILIVGSTSYIAKSIIPLLLKRDYEVVLISRSLNNLYLLDKRYRYDVIINCIREQNVDNKSVSDLFFTTEKYDNLIIDYIQKYFDTLYINLSSGAIYGKQFDSPILENTIAKIDINHINQEDYYCVNKIYLETKHRSLRHLNIVDIRLFSYFNRYTDLKVHHFIEQIIKSIIGNNVFKTDKNNIIRDFVHPEDLIQLIEICISKIRMNEYFDVYSLKPITKLEILDFFKKEYNLKFSFEEKLNHANVTGNKKVFYSENKKAEKFGYLPKFTSLETIRDEVKNLLY